MKVLIDTCVWSRVLRAENPDSELSNIVKELILDNRVVIIGPILQEILSGVKNKKQFMDLNEKLKGFDSPIMSQDIYVTAAQYFNVCKMHGVNGGHIDFLICAVVSYYNCALLTVDSDFELFKKYLPIKLLLNSR